MRKKSDKKSSPTEIHHLIRGGVIGATEVFLNHPLFVNKVRLQDGLKISFDPQTIYRGVIPSAFSMFPTVALQTGVYSWLQRIFDPDVPLNNTERSSCAIVAGLSSATVGCPTQRVLIYQTKTKQKFLATTQHLLKLGGVKTLYVGFTATALREGVMAFSFLHIAPYIKLLLKNYDYSEHQATFAAGISTGLFATLASHAIDVTKTTQQICERPQNMGRTMHKLYTENGKNVFFKGITPRSVRLMSGMTFMSWANEKWSELK